MKKENSSIALISFCKGLLCLFILFGTTQLIAQNDTIWYNKDWKISGKQEATFFRIPVQEKGGLFLIQDFYVSGNKQMIGTSKFATKDFWQGTVTWYNKDGTIFQQGNYKENKLDGKFITFIGDRKLVADYKGGRFISGKQNVSYSTSKYYKEFKGDTLVEINYSTSLKGRRTERYSLKREKYYSNIKAKYFDKNGDLITKISYDNGSPIDGEEVYFYPKTDNIKTISHYKNRNFLGTTYYDDSGQVREKFYSEPNYKSVYFSKDGKILDTIIYQLKDGRLTPYEGKKYYYKIKAKDDSSIVITSIYNYLNGNLKWIKAFEEGTIFSYQLYSERNSTDRIIYYNKNGKPKDSLIYKKYVPFQGTEYTRNNGIRKYSDGKLVEETVKYGKIDKVFKYRSGSLEQFYNKEGDKIGELKLEEESYYAPKEGAQFTIDHLDRITSEFVYKNGKKIKETYISYVRESDKGYKEETFFDEDGYDYLKKIKYYSNGQKRSDISFRRYKEKQGKFYDEDGYLLGTYDYENKDGTQYEFFYASDVVKKIEKWDKGKLVRLLRYEDKYVSGSEDKKYLLIEDIDVAKEAKIYSRDGGLLSKLTYKNGEPFQGTFYDYPRRTRSTYDAGKLNGKYEKFDYGTKVIESGTYRGNLKEGKFTHYNYSGVLTHFINYSNGLRQGEATYFNEEGKVTATMVFKDDLPFNGKQIVKDYNGTTTEVYKDGDRISKLVTKKTGDFFTTYNTDDKVENVEVYYPSTRIKKYKFSVKQNVLDGRVTRFDEKGNEMHTAIFENGRFKSGEVWVLPKYNYEKTLEKMICKKTENLHEVAFVSKNGAIVFNASEVPQPGIRSHINQLNLGLDYINYQDLY